MTQASTTVRIAGNGRLSLPTKHRRIVGLEHGGVAVVRVEDGEIRIRPVKSVVEEIQGLAAKYFAGSRIASTSFWLSAGSKSRKKISAGVNNVLDASAILALILRESGHDKVTEALTDGSAACAVNMAKMVFHCVRVGMPSAVTRTIVELLPIAWSDADADLAFARVRWWT